MFARSLAVLAAVVFVGSATAAELKFEVYKDNADEFRWRLKGGNGEKLATGGQGYKKKEDAKHGLELLQKADKDKWEVYEDEKKEFRWRLKAGNGQIVAVSSEGYKEKGGAEKAVKLIQDGIAKVEVTEVKDEK